MRRTKCDNSLTYRHEIDVYVTFFYRKVNLSNRIAAGASRFNGIVYLDPMLHGTYRCSRYLREDIYARRYLNDFAFSIFVSLSFTCICLYYIFRWREVKTRR